MAEFLGPRKLFSADAGGRCGRVVAGRISKRTDCSDGHRTRRRRIATSVALSCGYAANSALGLKQPRCARICRHRPPHQAPLPLRPRARGIYNVAQDSFGPKRMKCRRAFPHFPTAAAAFLRPRSPGIITSRALVYVDEIDGDPHLNFPA